MQSIHSSQQAPQYHHQHNLSASQQVMSMPSPQTYNSQLRSGISGDSPARSGQLPMARFGPAVYRQALDVDNLISVCTKKLQDDPSHKKALFIRGSSYLKKGMLEEAISDCNNLMQLDPEDAGAYYVRGCTYEK